MFKGMVMGMEVTNDEPSELVVVRFPKEVEDVVLVVVVEVLLLFPGRVLVVERVPELED